MLLWKKLRKCLESNKSLSYIRVKAAECNRKVMLSATSCDHTSKIQFTIQNQRYCSNNECDWNALPRLITLSDFYYSITNQFGPKKCRICIQIQVLFNAVMQVHRAANWVEWPVREQHPAENRGGSLADLLPGSAFLWWCWAPGWAGLPGLCPPPGNIPRGQHCQAG